MLSKMGWNEGEGLNSKRKADSIQAPISTIIRLNETAGLGSDTVGSQLSMDDVKSRQQKEKWVKTAKRYHGLATYTPAEKEAASGIFFSFSKKYSELGKRNSPSPLRDRCVRLEKW
jgi:G-patch domain